MYLLKSYVQAYDRVSETGTLSHKSGLKQMLMFKSHRVQHVAYILRKSEYVRGSHHTNKRGTVWDSTDYSRMNVKFNKKPKGQAMSGRGNKTKHQHMADILVNQPVLHAPSITGHDWNDVINKAKKYYMEQVYGKPIYSPALQENIQFSARGLVYGATKEHDPDKYGIPKGKGEIARRFALLPKAIEVIRTANTIHPHDIRTLPHKDSRSKDHKRYGLYGRFDDGIVVSVVVDEIQQEGKKFLSVFDFEKLEGSKLGKYLEAADSGPAVRHMQQTPGGDPHAPVENISLRENKFKKSHNPLHLIRRRGC